MPTAVERLAQYLQNALKLTAIDAPGDAASFATSDRQIDPAFAALTAATTPSELLAADRQFGAAFRDIGGGSAGLGADFQRDAFVFFAVDQYIGGASPNGANGGPSDFGAADRALFHAGADLKRFGAAFSELGGVRTHAGFAGLETVLQADAKSLQGDFAALSGDVSNLLADIAGPPAVLTSAPPSGVAAALTPFVSEFSRLADDFGGLSHAVGGGGGAGGPIASGGGGGAGSPAASFAALYTDFAAVDGSLQGLAAPLAGLLLPAVRMG